ncbi:hypothetical protein SK128_006377 [Halocaridina rubra]|uniref:Uncharacterized protein n=1 Tax=Halocaridina rubra TaxID=373956 RepID=A0AAN9A2G2_HALRR
MTPQSPDATALAPVTIWTVEVLGITELPDCFISLINTSLTLSRHSNHLDSFWMSTGRVSKPWKLFEKGEDFQDNEQKSTFISMLTDTTPVYRKQEKKQDTEIRKSVSYSGEERKDGLLIPGVSTSNARHLSTTVTSVYADINPKDIRIELYEGNELFSLHEDPQALTDSLGASISITENPKKYQTFQNNKNNTLIVSEEVQSLPHGDVIPDALIDQCQSLFSISQAPKYEFYVGRDKDLMSKNVTSYQGLHNSFRVFHRQTSEINRDLRFAKEIVRKISESKKNPSSISSTEEYHRLSLLLPPLLVLGNTSSAEKDTEGETGRSKDLSPFLTGYSRITAAGGMLPFIPCAIAPYNDVDLTVKTCIRKRIRKSGQFWIQFTGDSKIRYLFEQFLNRLNNHYNFTVAYGVSTR